MGENTKSDRTAIVLLSGLDSAAALHWSAQRFARVAALGFDYGQPGAELAAAQVIAERRGVEWVRQPVIGLGARDPASGRDDAGVSRANVPGRNGVLVWHAANIAARRWPGASVSIIVGCNADDATGFPDCRAEFLEGLSRSVRTGLAGSADVDVVAPWVDLPKWTIVKLSALHPGVLEDVRFAVSCYRGDRCGACDACTLRARAFTEAGVEDGQEPPPREHGGDPGREPRRQ